LFPRGIFWIWHRLVVFVQNCGRWFRERTINIAKQIFTNEDGIKLISLGKIIGGCQFEGNPVEQGVEGDGSGARWCVGGHIVDTMVCRWNRVRLYWSDVGDVGCCICMKEKNIWNKIIIKDVVKVFDKDVVKVFDKKFQRS
jgi:hypothetical protein